MLRRKPSFAALQIAPHVPKPPLRSTAHQHATEEINNIGYGGVTSSSSSSSSSDNNSVTSSASSESEEEKIEQTRSSRSKTAQKGKKKTNNRNAPKPKSTTASRSGKQPRSISYTREHHVKETKTLIDIHDSSEENDHSSISDSDEEEEETTTKKQKKPTPKKKPTVAAAAAAAATKKRERETTPTKSNSNSSNKKAKSVTLNDAPDAYISKSAFYTEPGHCSMTALRDALRDIMRQEDAIEQVIYKLHAQALTPFRSPNAADRKCSLHLTGGSGVGKTKTTELLARFFQVGPGTRYPGQYKSISLAKYGDQSHAVAMTGAAAGLLGHDNQDFVATLIQAAKRVDPVEDNPFILLALDEADKAHPAFMNALNPLLSEGRIANVREQCFTIPRGTLLIIVWVSNFAEHIMNPYENPEQTTRYIYDRMRRQGFDNCDIARMGGDPIVYNPLHRDDMYQILLGSGNERLEGHEFSRRFGVPRYSDRLTETASRAWMASHADTATAVVAGQSNVLILNILQTYKIELGVRHPLEKYKTEIEALLTSAIDVLDREETDRSSSSSTSTKLLILDDVFMDAVDVESDGWQQQQQQQEEMEGPVYWCVRLEVTEEQRQQPRDQFLAMHPQLRTAIGQNRRNARVLETIFRQGSRYTMLEYVVLRFTTRRGQILYAYSLLQPVHQAELLGASGSTSPVHVRDSRSSSSSGSSSSSNSEEDEKAVKKRRKAVVPQPVAAAAVTADVSEIVMRVDDLETKTDKHSSHIQHLNKNQVSLQQQITAHSQALQQQMTTHQQLLQQQITALGQVLYDLTHPTAPTAAAIEDVQSGGGGVTEASTSPSSQQQSTMMATMETKTKHHHHHHSSKSDVVATDEVQ